MIIRHLGLGLAGRPTVTSDVENWEWRGRSRKIPGAPARDIIKGPVAGILRAALLLLPMLAGCSINQLQHAEWRSDWVDVSSDAIFPGNSTTLPLDRISTLDPDSEAAIAEWMLKNALVVVSASEVEGKIGSMPLSGLKPAPGESVYLVRTASDEGNGTFIGYVNDKGLLIMYGIMGGCGEQKHRVVAVSLREKPANVFGRCSAAL